MNCESCIKRKVCAFIPEYEKVEKRTFDIRESIPTIFRVTPECLEYIQKPERLPLGCVSNPADVDAAIAEANATMDRLINAEAVDRKKQYRFEYHAQNGYPRFVTVMAKDETEARHFFNTIHPNTAIRRCQEVAP